MGFWGWVLAVYAALTAIVATGDARSESLALAGCVVGASFLAPAAAGGFKAAFFGGDRTMKAASSIIAAAVLALAFWLSLQFDVRLFGIGVSGAVWAAIGASLGYAYAEKGETYYLPEPSRKPAVH